MGFGHHHGHDHDHDHGHDHHDHGAHEGTGSHDHAQNQGDSNIARALTIALALTVGFMGVELTIAIWKGSLALLADAGHMVSDAGSLALALFATRLARRPRSPRKTFGYRRVEVLAALANGVGLGVTAVLIVIEAVQRLRAPTPVDGSAVLEVGAIGLAVNLASAWVLSRGASNLNVRAALAHVIGDALGSIAAMLAGAVVLLTGEVRADPALALVVAAIILVSAWRLVAETAHILMEGAPAGLDPRQITETICGVAGVTSVHDVHVWSISPEVPAITAHVVLGPGFHGDQVALAVGEALERRFGVRHATIQPEPPAPSLVKLGAHPRPPRSP